MTEPTYTDDDLAAADAELADVDEDVTTDEPDVDEAPDALTVEKGV